MNKKESLITVYITNHNYGKYIKQSIDSVFNQTYKNFELIIIDDGSTDNSKNVIEKYKKKLYHQYYMLIIYFLFAFFLKMVSQTYNLFDYQLLI